MTGDIPGPSSRVIGEAYVHKPIEECPRCYYDGPGLDGLSAPRASTSFTRCPLATPPMAGLQDICPIVSRFIVTTRVESPILAAASEASQPACPAPTTMTSYKD